MGAPATIHTLYGRMEIFEPSTPSTNASRSSALLAWGGGSSMSGKQQYQSRQKVPTACLTVCVSSPCPRGVSLSLDIITAPSTPTNRCRWAAPIDPAFPREARDPWSSIVRHISRCLFPGGPRDIVRHWGKAVIRWPSYLTSVIPGWAGPPTRQFWSCPVLLASSKPASCCPGYLVARSILCSNYIATSRFDAFLALVLWQL